MLHTSLRYRLALPKPQEYTKTHHEVPAILYRQMFHRTNAVVSLQGRQLEIMNPLVLQYLRVVGFHPHPSQPV